MTDADKLAQVLAEQVVAYVGRCTCHPAYKLRSLTDPDCQWHALGDDFASETAAVVLAHLTAEGWAQTVAEEWGVYRPELNDHNVINMGERGQADAVAKMSNRRESGRGGSHVVRRRVTDWEEA